MAAASDIDPAAERLRAVAERTLLRRSDRVSAETAEQVWLKREDLEPVRSYRVRGACNLLAQLPRQQRSQGSCAPAPATTGREWRSPGGRARELYLA